MTSSRKVLRNGFLLDKAYRLNPSGPQVKRGATKRGLLPQSTMGIQHAKRCYEDKLIAARHVEWLLLANRRKARGLVMRERGEPGKKALRGTSSENIEGDRGRAMIRLADPEIQRASLSEHEIWVRFVNM